MQYMNKFLLRFCRVRPSTGVPLIAFCDLCTDASVAGDAAAKEPLRQIVNNSPLEVH